MGWVPPRRPLADSFLSVTAVAAAATVASAALAPLEDTWFEAANDNLKLKPNILLLTTDQQRVDSIGCYGGTVSKTPNLDRLAKEGTLFTESYTASPVCQSARESLLRGVQVPVHGVWGNGIRQSRTNGQIVKPLKEAGYYTAVIGKTHYSPLPAFDFKDIHSANMDMRQNNTPESKYLETYLVNQTVRLLDGAINTSKKIKPGQPWFVHLSFISPHPPVFPPNEWKDLYRNVEIPKAIYGGPQEVEGFPSQLRQLQAIIAESEEAHAYPNLVKNDAVIQEARRLYMALVAYVDAQVGRMLDYLDQRGIADTTLVIFSSDHGSTLFDHAMAQKYNFFDKAWRVPLILRGAGVPRGQVRTFASGVDVPATIVAAAGAFRSAQLNGYDLYTPLRAGKPLQRQYGVAAVYMAGLAVVTSRWKLVYYQNDQRGQLFDRMKDPEELGNLFDDPAHTPVRDILLMALLRWHSNLQPIMWLQAEAMHILAGDFAVDYNYTMSLKGETAENQLQIDLANPVLQNFSVAVVK